MDFSENAIVFPQMPQEFTIKTLNSSKPVNVTIIKRLTFLVTVFWHMPNVHMYKWHMYLCNLLDSTRGLP